MAKTRRVVVTLEIETDASLTDLRSGKVWSEIMRYAGYAMDGDEVKVLQAEANVVSVARVAPKK